jgi:hypothetical protein
MQYTVGYKLRVAMQLELSEVGATITGFVIVAGSSRVPIGSVKVEARLLMNEILGKAPFWLGLPVVGPIALEAIVGKVAIGWKGSPYIITIISYGF